MAVAAITLLAAPAMAAAQTTPDAPSTPAPAGWREFQPVTLAISYKVPPAARAELRKALRGQLHARLSTLKASGDVHAFTLLMSRYTDAAGWDGLALIEFANVAALGRWRAVEAETPAGLPASALQRIETIETAPGAIVRQDKNPSSVRPTYLVIPYDYLVSTDEYVRYVDGYVVPQMRGWMREGAIDAYRLFLPRYAAGRNWSSLLLLSYRGDDGLAARDRVVAKVRAELNAGSPEWRAFAANKADLRVEKPPVVADEVVP